MICQMKIENKWSLYRHITPLGKVYIDITSQKPDATEVATKLGIDISYLNRCCRLSKICKGYKFVRI